MTDHIAETGTMIKQVAENSGEWMTQPLPDALRAAESAEVTNDSSEEPHEKILLTVAWCQPEWSDKPLLKLDCPEMGYLSYKAPPPPAHD
jgi:hypothetical protein